MFHTADISIIKVVLLEGMSLSFAQADPGYKAEPCRSMVSGGSLGATADHRGGENIHIGKEMGTPHERK